MTAVGGSLTVRLLDGVLHLPGRRVRSARGGRAAADRDEDAVTLAATAALKLLEGCQAAPRALVLATTSPPYDEGGNVQLVAELAGLSGELFAAELTGTVRDGLAAARIAAALVRAQGGEVMVLASHRRRLRGDGDAGDGAVAMLLGAEGGVASLSFGVSRVEELRDRWRLAGDPVPREGDPSFVWWAGAPRLARELVAEGTAVVGGSLRETARAELAGGGPGDRLGEAAGLLGAAHALGRLLVGLDEIRTLVCGGAGLVDSVWVEAGPGAEEIAGRARAVLDDGWEGEQPLEHELSEGFSPYASLPRAWRERGQDLRLEASRCGTCGAIHYPPPQVCPRCGFRSELEHLPLRRTGTVLTVTRDHLYPAARVTGMAVVELDGGGRFYGQVVPSAKVEPGARVRLVPRRLHEGGGFVQYYWKIAPEDGG